MQTLPTKTQRCDDDDIDLTKEFCTAADLTNAAAWCQNPNPTQTLVCDGVVCGVPAKGNKCVNGRQHHRSNTFAQECPPRTVTVAT